MKIDIIFNPDQILFQNFNPLIELVKDEFDFESEYENIRYFIEDESYTDKLSLTSRSDFSNRIRFYHYSKIDQPIQYFTNKLFQKLEYINGQIDLTISNFENIKYIDWLLLRKIYVLNKMYKNSINFIMTDSNKDIEKILRKEISKEDKFKKNSCSYKELYTGFMKSMNFGVYEDSIKFGNEIVDKYPDQINNTLLLNLGLSYVLFDEPHKGELIYTKVIENEQNPKILADIHYCLSMLYMRHNVPLKLDVEKAQNYLEKAYEIIESNKENLGEDYLYKKIFNRNGIALIKFKNKEYNIAHNYCVDGQRELLNFYGNSKHILHRSVIIYNCTMTAEKLKRYEEAKLYFDLLLTLDPYYSDYWYHRGKFYQRIGNQDNAKFNFERAIELNPFEGLLYLEYASFLEEENNKQSEKYYRKAMELNPDNLIIIRNYTAYLLSNEFFEEVIEIWRKLKMCINFDKDIINNFIISSYSLSLPQETKELYELIIPLESELDDEIRQNIKIIREYLKDHYVNIEEY